MAGLQKTIKALVSKQFAMRQIGLSGNSPPSTPATAKAIAAFLTSATLAIVLGAIWCYFTVSGLVHMGTARAILIFAWIIGTVGIIVSDWIWGKPFVHRIRLGIAASMLLGIILWGLDAWTVRHRPLDVHIISWMDFPVSLVDRIAEAVDKRISPRIIELKKVAEYSPSPTTTPSVPPSNDFYRQMQDPHNHH
jgi:hypothetical protein